MGQTQSIEYSTFEIIQKITSNDILIHTMNVDEQNVLIHQTISAENEENKINSLMKERKWNVNIIIYGKNWMDKKVNTKYEQLKKLGFQQVSIYNGGLFEWLLLQDIYGPSEFPTTSKELDLLKYKPIPIINSLLLMNEVD